jgi:mRNA-degrading endonuclease RelE of RelBE toxin-antitoxin system
MYRVFVDVDAAKSLQTFRKSDRELIFRFLDLLANNPFRRGELQISDESGHTIEIQRVGSFWIWFWSDHAVKQVKILAVERRSRVASR